MQRRYVAGLVTIMYRNAKIRKISLRKMYKEKKEIERIRAEK